MNAMHSILSLDSIAYPAAMIRLIVKMEGAISVMIGSLPEETLLCCRPARSPPFRDWQLDSLIHGANSPSDRPRPTTYY